MGKINKGLKKARTRHLAAVAADEAHNRTLDALTELYKGKVGAPYDPIRLEEIYKEGAKRYPKKIPPGYMDAGKDGDRQYGDLVLWRQILDHAAVEKKPMLFITEDTKEDWWHKTGSTSHGPRPELVEEYLAVSGERIHFYTPRRFLQHALVRGESISEATVAEAKTVSTNRMIDWGEAMKGYQGALASTDRVAAQASPERLEAARRAMSEFSSRREHDIGAAARAALEAARLYEGPGFRSSAAQFALSESERKRALYDAAISAFQRLGFSEQEEKAIADAQADALGEAEQEDWGGEEAWTDDDSDDSN